MYSLVQEGSGSANHSASCREGLLFESVMQIARKYVLTDMPSSLLNTDRLIHMFLIKHVSKCSPEWA